MNVVRFPRNSVNRWQKYVDCLHHLAEELEEAGLTEAAMFVTAAAGSIAEAKDSERPTAPVTPSFP